MSNSIDNGDGTQSVRVHLDDTSGSAATVADGADVNAGTTTDAAVITDTAGTLSAKLRGLVVLILAMSAKLPASLGIKTAAASLSVTHASDDAVLTVAGATGDAVVAAGAVGTLSAKLRRVTQGLEDLKSLIVLAAGDNNIGNVDLASAIPAGSSIIGRVGIDQTTPGTTDSVTTKSKGYTSGQVSVTRPSNTNTYGAGDVVGATAAAITFPTMGPAAGGEALITSVTFERDASAIISGETSYTLHLYSVTPPSALADEATWDLPSGDRASYLGRIELGTPVDVGSSLWVEQNGVNKQVTLASSNLYGYLVTNGGYTAASAAVHRLQLHSVAV